MIFLRRHAFFLLFFGALFVFFTGPLLLVRTAFLVGDNGVQFHPWALALSQSLKQGTLPYWTDLIACGFPLVAEGQVAAYYPPNILFFLLLPFKAAYSWTVPAHLLVGGIGFYVYGRRIGLGERAAALAAVVFSFSSGYGGCFYTMGTLRVLTWVPWTLLALDAARRAPNAAGLGAAAAGAGVCFGLMGTGGFPQAAAYAALYVLVLTTLEPGRQRTLPVLAVGALVGFVLASPQILQTLELAGESARAGADSAFALWGSLPPPALASFLFPEWGPLLRVTLFLGIAPLFLAAAALFSRKTPVERAHAWTALLFLLLAFGKYNPLYALAVERLPLTALRNPSKFLFFTLASLAVLAGFGFAKTFAGPLLKGQRRAIAVLAALCVLLPSAASATYRAAEPKIAEYGRSLADAAYASKTDKMKPVEEYHATVRSTLARAADVVRPLNPWNLYAGALGLLTAALLLAAAGRADRREALAWGLAALVTLDLAATGAAFSTGFVKNAKPYPPAKAHAAVELAGKEAPRFGAGRVIEWARREPALLEPSMNMLHGLSHPGAYSPLLLERHYTLTKELGISDASLGRFPLSAETWGRQSGLIDSLGVGLAVSDEKLSMGGFRLLDEAGGRFLYENAGVSPLVYAVYRWQAMTDVSRRLAHLKGPDFLPKLEAVVETDDVPPPLPPIDDAPMVHARILTRRPDFVKALLDVKSVALCVFSQSHYPGWRAELDGNAVPLVRVNHAFMGAWVPSGRHEILFHRPVSAAVRGCEWAAAAGWVLALVFLALRALRRSAR